MSIKFIHPRTFITDFEIPAKKLKSEMGLMRARNHIAEQNGLHHWKNARKTVDKTRALLEASSIIALFNGYDGLDERELELLQRHGFFRIDDLREVLLEQLFAHSIKRFREMGCGVSKLTEEERIIISARLNRDAFFIQTDPLLFNSSDDVYQAILGLLKFKPSYIFFRGGCCDVSDVYDDELHGDVYSNPFSG